MRTIPGPPHRHSHGEPLSIAPTTYLDHTSTPNRSNDRLGHIRAHCLHPARLRQCILDRVSLPLPFPSLLLSQSRHPLTHHSLSYYRARRLGLPPPNFNPFNRAARRDPAAYHAPAPAPSGIKGWITDKIDALRNKRTAGGAYESTSYGVGGSSRGRDRRGFGALDPDEAWDARVGNEADHYYEEQELGLQDPNPGPYGGRGYGEVGAGHVGVGGIPDERGRSRSRQRELDDRYDEEVHGGQPRNPFGDDNEAGSMRTASPRPMADGAPGGSQRDRVVSQHRKGQSSLSAKEGDSPTERRSMFREDV